jgi:hypothetical protein
MDRGPSSFRFVPSLLPWRFLVPNTLAVSLGRQGPRWRGGVWGAHCVGRTTAGSRMSTSMPPRLNPEEQSRERLRPGKWRHRVLSSESWAEAKAASGDASMAEPSPSRSAHSAAGRSARQLRCSNGWRARRAANGQRAQECEANEQRASRKAN